MVNEACDTEASEASLATPRAAGFADGAKDPPEAAAADEELAKVAAVSAELAVVTAGAEDEATVGGVGISGGHSGGRSGDGMTSAAC